MSRTKITLSEEQADTLAVLIENGVRTAMKDYVDARLGEELEAVYGHLEEIMNNIATLGIKTTEIADILRIHIEGATNEQDQDPNPGEVVGPGDEWPSG